VRLWCAVIVVLGVSHAASAQTGSRAVPYTSPDGTFRAIFPCTPKPQPLPTDAGPGSTPRLLLDCIDNDLFAGVTESTIPVVLDPEGLLTDMRNKALSRVGAQLLSEERITISGYPGRFVRASGPNNLLIACRFMVLPESRRLYQLTSVSNGSRPEELRMIAFLESFAILKAPAPAPGTPPTAFLIAVANEANQTMPLRIDQDTEMMNTAAMDGVFIYNNRLVNFTAAELDAAKLRAALQPSVTNAACTNPTLKNLLDAGVAVRYTYSDKDRRHVLQFDVTPSDCKQ
jgi:hypothetical protein